MGLTRRRERQSAWGQAWQFRDGESPGAVYAPPGAAHCRVSEYPRRDGGSIQYPRLYKPREPRHLWRRWPSCAKMWSTKVPSSSTIGAAHSQDQVRLPRHGNSRLNTAGTDAQPAAAEATALGIFPRGELVGLDRGTGASSSGREGRTGLLTAGNKCNGRDYDGLQSPDFLRFSQTGATRGAAEGPPSRGRGGRSKFILFGVHQSVELQVVARRLSGCGHGGATVLSSIIRGPRSKGTNFLQYPKIYLELESKSPGAMEEALVEWKRVLQPYNWRVISEEVRCSEAVPRKGEGSRGARTKMTDFFRSENPFSPLTESPKKLQHPTRRVHCVQLGGGVTWSVPHSPAASAQPVHQTLSREHRRWEHASPVGQEGGVHEVPRPVATAQLALGLVVMD